MDHELGNQLMSKAGANWQEFRGSRDPASLRLLFLFILLTTGLGIYLIAGPRPWEQSIVKRLTAGKELKVEQFVQVGVWWGAAAGFLASLIALATVRWWSRPHTAPFPDLQPASRSMVRWTWIFALAATLLSVWPRYARLDHSLWTDEEYHLRTYVLGTWQPGTDENAPLKLDAVTWPEAIFGNEKGNNHVWSSIEVRLGHLLGGHGWGPDTSFSERSLRLFPFVSGLLTVGAVVLLGAALGSPRAGLAAGLILALHPWHVRWSVEIRGYSTMLFGITAGLICLLLALRTNRWRWWLGYAAAQTLFLLCFAGSFYVVVAQNAAALLLIRTAPAPGPVRLAAASRLITAGILSFIPAALILGPHVPQIAAYLKSSHDYAPIGAAWFNDLWTHLVTGLRPSGDLPGSSQGIGLSDLTAAAPWKKSLIYGLVPLLLAGGLVRLFRQDWRTRLVAGTLAGAGTLAIVHNALSGSAFLSWYLLYLLPLFVLGLAWAAQGLATLSPRRLVSLPLVLAVLYSVLTAPALTKIMHVPRQPIREVITAMRGKAPALQESNPAILTASFGGGARQMLSYDPHLRVLKSPGDLNDLTNLAATSGRPLFLCFRDLNGMAAEEPQLLAAVTGDPRWQRLPDIMGMEAMWSYELYRFAPESIGRIGLKP